MKIKASHAPHEGYFKKEKLYSIQNDSLKKSQFLLNMKTVCCIKHS